MRSRRLFLLVPVLAAVVAPEIVTSQQPVPPMDIREYKPRSTLIVPAHEVPRAKFPVIDIHSHHPRSMPEARWQSIVKEMDALNIRVLVNLSGGTGEALRNTIDERRRGPHGDRMLFFANIDFDDLNEPGFGARAAARLEADVKAGARGLKLFKNFGLRLSRANGARVPVDDPALDPVWETCARLRIPVLIHTGEPQAFFDPVDRFNERWLELQLRPQNRLPPSRYPTFDALMAERDRLFARHPQTTFIVAHMGWHANDLGRLSAMMDRLPNTVVETGAILAELGRQPRTARAFFERYQDRILFGKDRYEASEYPYYWRVFETADEYFDYYRDYHAFWKLYGMALPDGVLRKVYYDNSARLLGLPRLPS